MTIATSVYQHEACAEEAVKLMIEEENERTRLGHKLSPPHLATTNPRMSEALRQALKLPSEEFMRALDRAIARERYRLFWRFVAKRRVFEIKDGQILLTQ